MIAELIEAVIEQAPKKARALQNRGPDTLEKAVRGTVKRARET